MADKILVLGGYGVFGGRLARRLAEQTDAEIIVAGRSVEKAEAHCRAFGGTPFAMDRDRDLDRILAAMRPSIVIDAAGPFQAYGDDPYRVARAAIATGAHYLDLADDGFFVAGISRLDDAAKAAGVSVISGASSIPAISAAALDELTRGLANVAVVGSAILPGNRAPRGLSMVRAILGQVGRPLNLWRGGRWVERTAWGDLRRFRLTTDKAKPLPMRLASTIGAPDLILFPVRYGARSVLFHAGLELKVMHLGLRLLAWPVRFGWVRSIEPCAGGLKWIADRLESFGSDRGGMIVYAIGRDEQNNAVERRWTLIAEAGEGPEIPPTPALLLARKLLRRERPGAGASPASGLLSLDEIEVGLSSFRVRCGRDERAAPPLLERVLPMDFPALPEAWRRLAEIHDIDHFEGVASVERGPGLAARLIAGLFGFPSATPSVPVSVTKERTAGGETWTRRFGGKPFVSYLSRRPDDGPGLLWERFGPFSFRLRLSVDDGRVVWPVVGWRFLGIPMPSALKPESEAFEMVGADGKFRFDVALSLPFAGLVVRYRGWLEPAPSQGLSSTVSPATAPSSWQA